LHDFNPLEHTIPLDKLTPLDRWILDAFSTMEKEVMNAYERSEFHQVYQRISQFISMELSAIYHDAIKDRMYTIGVILYGGVRLKQRCITCSPALHSSFSYSGLYY
jgi:isoleucyl-tRNA synthetase